VGSQQGGEKALPGLGHKEDGTVVTRASEGTFSQVMFPHIPRSFGVVLWELLTGEIPYKDVDSSAIIWGVGSNSLHLPVPSSCPDGFKILLRQCW
jgi:hypothetical protein